MSNTSNKIATLCAVIAIAISVISCFISQKSSEIAESSLNIAKENKEMTLRPYLSITPVKFEETKAYLKVTADYDKLTISVKAKFQIKNNGKTPATNILCPKNVGLTLKLPVPKHQGTTPNFSYSSCPTSNLAPDDVVFMNIDMAAQINNSKLIKAAFDGYNSGNRDVSWEIPLYYSSLLNPSKQYLTMVSYKISKKESLFIKSKIE